ncbi:hypothetical protein BH11PAT1_BH11PAT1_7760 [soil metagenome]
MDDIYETIEDKKYRTDTQPVTFRDILVNAIKMQAMYTNGKIRYTETSSVSN